MPHARLNREAIATAYALRRRELAVVSALTCIAGLGLAVWTGKGLALGWTTAILALFMVDLALHRALAARADIPRWAEPAMCAMALTLTSAYTIMPVVLLLQGDWTSAIGAVCMMCAASYRCVNEFAVTYRVGVAAVAPFFVGGLSVLFAKSGLALPEEQMFASVALVTMFAYTSQSWFRTHSLERARRSAEDNAQTQMRARQEAEDANTAKSRFLANMSHELRTPLNAIIGYSELLRDGADSDQRAQDIADHDRVIAAARHLLGLIGDVLDFSKIEAGRMDIVASDFDVAALAAEALEMVRPAAQGQRNRLTLTVAADVGLACTDAFKLKQCLLNLLSNAIKFTEDGAVTLDVAREGGLLRFAVRDTGQGIAPDQLDHLFRPFVQADASLTRVHGGTGLGLAITRKLARMMGGDVAVQSAPGAGSTFTLTVLERHMAPADRAPLAA